jgi:Ca-activated chloride channel family protein
LEVRVYTVLVGRGGEVPMPMQARDPLTGQITRRTVSVRVDIDEDLLKTIAQRTGGEFFRANDPTALRDIFERIDRLEKSEIKLTAYPRYRELYPPVLAAAAALFGLGGLAWLAGLRVAPA